MKIKKDDKVKIISGKDNGKTGKVIRVISAEGKLIVEGVNIVKKHVKPKSQKEKGQRVEAPGPIDASNVMLICPKCGKAVRVGFEIKDDKKVRICKKCGAEV